MKFAWLALFPAVLLAQTLDLPLTVAETAGIARTAEPVTFGVPLPRGMARDTARLRLIGQDGSAVPASFRVANRWMSDNSVQWIHADFLADAPAGGNAVYRLQLSDTPSPAPRVPLKIAAASDQVTVNTGAVEFTVHRNGRLLNGPGLREADLVLRSDERIYKASLWPASELVVEEQTPVRVVLKRTGAHAWVDGKDKALDYVVRIYAWAGQPHIRIVYSFINRQGSKMSEFVRLDGLWLQAKLERQQQPTLVEQLSAEPRRTGWFEAGGIGFGLRWFWQLYPKGFEARQDGLVRLALFPDTARPQNIYTGVAKTHEMIVSFGGRNLSGQLDHPLYAVADPKWYTRDTRALGRLVESSAEAIRPQYWPLVQKYDRWLVNSRDAVLAKRDRGFQFRGRRYDEYGMLNFGDAMHKLIADDSRPDFGIHWDTEYYDFPHTLFLHFFRTGDMTSLRTAIEAAAHLSDVDISHYEPETGYHGAARTGPGLNHWTRYSNGVFVSSGSWAFYKNEGLFDRWLLTGDHWSRDVARLSSDWGVNYNGLDLQSNTRSIGHGLFAQMRACEVLGDRKYLDRVNWIIDSVHAWQDGDVDKLRTLNKRAVWDPVFKGGYSDQAWMYGIALEGMAQASLLTGRKEMPDYMRRAADWIYGNPKEWVAQKKQYYRYQDLAIMLTPGLAYIGETSGQRVYWDRAMESFERQVGESRTASQLKLFAQYFRNSQRFLWYLSVDAPPAP
jgi:hypothetical protein